MFRTLKTAMKADMFGKNKAAAGMDFTPAAEAGMKKAVAGKAFPPLPRFDSELEAPGIILGWQIGNQKKQIAEDDHLPKKQTVKPLRLSMKEEFPDVDDWSDLDDPDFDVLASDAIDYRHSWEDIYAAREGPYEKTTPIPPMRYTEGPVPSYASTHYDTVQFFSAKIGQLRGDLQWPIQVFGVIAARDCIDHNRITVFNRTRDNCQTLTQQDPYLLLTGPTRAPVVCDPLYIEAMLTVKGSNESEDKDVTLLAKKLADTDCDSNATHMICEHYTNKLGTLELTCAYIAQSVEATISVQLIKGPWPDGFRCQFTAHTSSLKHQSCLLLDTGDGKKLPVDDDGMVQLSRRVVCVEFKGKLKVCAMEFRCDTKRKVEFVPKMTGRSHRKVDMGFCKMNVTVAWSLLSLVPSDD